MDEFLLPSSVFIVLGSLIAIIGIQMTGKARRTARQDSVSADTSGPFGRGRTVAATGWFLFLLGFLGLLATRLV